jgi:hypothetical protein
MDPLAAEAAMREISSSLREMPPPGLLRAAVAQPSYQKVACFAFFYKKESLLLPAIRDAVLRHAVKNVFFLREHQQKKHDFPLGYAVDRRIGQADAVQMSARISVMRQSS